MLQLVAELPGVFRRGEAASSSLPSTTRRLFEDPGEECTYRLRRLEDLAAELKEGWKPVAVDGLTGPKPAKHWHDSESDFLRTVPDKGLELHHVWTRAWEFCQPADEERVREMALQAICRRFAGGEGWLRERLADLKPQPKDMVIFLPVLRAELEKLKVVLAAVTAGSSGAEALAAKALANQSKAEARCAAAAASVTSLAQRGPRQQAAQKAQPAPLRHAELRAPRAASVPSSHLPPTSPSSPQPPIQPPSSAVEGIQRWVESVRQTGSVAASSNDRDWRRQLDVLRAGLTGTKAVCLSPEKAEKSSRLPSLPSRRNSSASNLEECPICLEPLRPQKQMLVPLIPLPCGHSFHAACAYTSQLRVSNFK